MSTTTEAPAERDSTELEALSELVTSDGWRLFRERIDAEWGSRAVMRQIDSAIVNSKGEPVENDIREIAAAARKIQVAVQWPESRVKELKAKGREKPGMFAQFKRA